MLEAKARAAASLLFFLTSAICLHAQQWLGAPLYWFHQRWYYSWQANVKQSVAVLLFGLYEWCSPTQTQISGDSSVAGQIRKTPRGGVRLDFDDRIVLTANHQIYTDWIFLWWSAYNGGYHGHLFVVLKDAIKKIPLIGPGLMFFSWIFLSRKWEADKPRFQHRISQLSNPESCAPIWLLIFPEGTNLSRRSRKLSSKWAAKTGVPDLELALLPRSRGLQYCLQAVDSSVEWMYDCTIGYEGIPRAVEGQEGKEGQEIYSLKKLFLEGKPAPMTHMHWRRFAISKIPCSDSDEFDNWLYQRWLEKDELLKYFEKQGRFPAHNEEYVKVSVKLGSAWELLQLVVSVCAAVAVWCVVSFLLRRAQSLVAIM